AEAAAEIEIANLRETLEQRDELLPRIAPRLRCQHAAAGVRMQTDDLGAGPVDEPLQLVELEHRHAELRMHAGGAHVLVMSAPLPRVDSNEELRAAEHVGPCLERVEIVE